MVLLKYVSELLFSAHASHIFCNLWPVRREAAMQEGLKRAVGVPLGLAERVSILWPSLKEMVLYGNIACKSDAQVPCKHAFNTVQRSDHNV